MCITWPHICFTIHLLWCVLYTVIGTIQIICGVFFWVSLPVLKLGSNIWVGAWNVVFGLGGAVTAMIGNWTLTKQRSFLYLAISILIVNVINVVLLEVGEWHLLLPESAKKLIEQGNLKTLILYARTITTISTLVAVVVAFLDSQLTFCSMQYHERYHNKKSSEKQDVLSDTEYVLPRVKSDSDENDNAGYYDKQYPQSWVYETHTAETSTINSVPNRYSGSSSENVIDSKKTSTDTEFKDISSQNLRMEQPVVVVEKTADYTDRQLHYMASFSRTPSPTPGSDSSSEDLRPAAVVGTIDRRSSEKTHESSTYRGRINSTRSTSGVPLVDEPPYSMTSRPLSISEMDKLPNELMPASLQETTSQKSFKISADQIFIPLKDETVIRVKDEIFILPSPKLEESTAQTKAQLPKVEPQPLQSLVSSFKEEKRETSTFLTQKTEKVETKLEQITSKVMESVRKPTLPEIVDAVPKASSIARMPTPEKAKNIDEDLLRSVPAPTLPPPSVNEGPPRSETLQEPDPTSEGVLDEDSPAGTYTLPSPMLERTSKLDKQNTLKEREYELPSPSLERQIHFDRQDTVIERKPYTPSPVLERQSQIERQDAMTFSPREDQCFIPPPFESDPSDEGARSDDLESNGSTDKDSVVDVRYSDHLPGTAESAAICDRLDLLDGITVTEQAAANSDISKRVNTIFHAFDELRHEGGSGSEENSLSAKLDKGSSELPPPDLDPMMFTSIPPPDEVDAGNGVDPDEWEESDEDSIDSNCARRVPPA